MTQAEKESPLFTFSLPARWCKGMDACDDQGEPMSYDHPTAVAWDLPGGICRLFGWHRAMQLFPQLARCLINGKATAQCANAAIRFMITLQEFNDHPDTAHDMLLASIQSIPSQARGPLKEPKETSDV